MSRQQHVRLETNYLLSISLLSLLLLALLTAFPPEVPVGVSWRKTLVGVVFILICMLGIVAVYMPKLCQRLFVSKNSRNDINSDLAEPALHGASSGMRGHHPTCGRFEAHIIKIKDKIYCAACIGLSLGGLTALTMAAAYFFGVFQSAGQASLLVLLGIAGVGCGLFQFKFDGFIRLLANSTFVLGALSVLIGTDELVHSLFFDLFVVSLIVFWILTRISLSQWDHRRICAHCRVEYCRVGGK